jgi:hypothetical protein
MSIDVEALAREMRYHARLKGRDTTSDYVLGWDDATTVLLARLVPAEDEPDTQPPYRTLTMPSRMRPAEDEGRHPPFDHGGTYRHHHDSQTGDPIWWERCEQFGGEKREHRHAKPAEDEGRLPPDVRAGAALASALMDANYPGDSGEDVDRLIAELGKRGYRLQHHDDDDDILRAVVDARRDSAEDEGRLREARAALLRLDALTPEEWMQGRGADDVATIRAALAATPEPRT